MTTSTDRDHDRTSRGNFDQITNIATYRQPMLATLNGRPVKIVAVGDAPGHSAVCQYVTERGSLEWAEQNRFTVIDGAFLPPSDDTLQELARSISRR